MYCVFFSSRRRHTRYWRDWSSDVCSSDLTLVAIPVGSMIGGALVWLTGAGLVWTLGIGVLWGGAAGVWAAVKLMGYVSYDEPLRYQRRLVRGEFSRRFGTTEELKPIEVDFAFPQIGYLSAPVRRA